MPFYVGELVAPLNIDQSGFNRTLSQVFRKGAGVERLGRNMTKWLTLPFIGASAAIFKFGSDFETELSKIEGLVGISRDQINAWKGDLQDMAGEVGKGPEELAQGLFFVTSAGFRGAEALDILDKSARASAAGLGETKTIADLVTSAINAYGIENLDAAEATDILVASVREGKAEAPELAASMGQVLPIASELGVSFDQVGASIAAMTRTGTDASTASIQLRQILASLLKPTSQAEDALAEMGTSSRELRKTLREDGLVSVLGFLRQQMEENEQAMSQVFPNIRALSGALDIMGSNAEENVQIYKNLTDTTGSLEHAFDAVSKTGKQGLNRLLSELKSTSTALYEDGIELLLNGFDALRHQIRGLRNTWNSLEENVRRNIFIFGGLAAAAGPVLTILGTMGMAIGSLSAPILGLVGVTGAAATAIITNWDGIVDYFTNGDGAQMWDDFKGIVSNTTDLITGLWDEMGNEIIQITEKSFGIVLETIGLTLGQINTIMSKFNGDFNDELNVFEDNILTTLSKIDSKIVGFATSFAKFLYKEFVTDPLEVMGVLETEAERSARKAGESLASAKEEMLSALGGREDVIIEPDIQIPEVDMQLGSMVFATEGIERTRIQAQLLGSTISKDVNGNLADMRANSDLATEGFSTLEIAMGKADEQLGIVKDDVVSMGEALQATATNAITGFAETLGNALSGDTGAEGFFNNLLLVVNDFANQFGKLLVGAGVAALAFKKLLVNPVAAIAAGGALIAATTAVRNHLKEGIEARALGGPVTGGQTYLVGERGPELFTPNTSGMISPNSRVMAGNTKRIRVDFAGEFVQRGSDMRAVINESRYIDLN